jgi:hypothetical protein
LTQVVHTPKSRALWHSPQESADSNPFRRGRPAAQVQPGILEEEA